MRISCLRQVMTLMPNLIFFSLLLLKIYFLQLKEIVPFLLVLYVDKHEFYRLIAILSSKTSLNDSSP